MEDTRLPGRVRSDSSPSNGRGASVARDKEYLNLSRTSSISDLQQENGVMKLRNSSASSTGRRRTSSGGNQEDNESLTGQQGNRRRSSLKIGDSDEFDAVVVDLLVKKANNRRRSSVVSATTPKSKQDSHVGYSPSKRSVSRIQKLNQDLSNSLPSYGILNVHDLIDQQYLSNNLESKSINQVNEEDTNDNDSQSVILEDEVSHFDALSRAISDIEEILNEQKKKRDLLNLGGSNATGDIDDLIARLDGVSNLLKSIDLEESMLRAEQIEKAMVAEVMDYENSLINPYNEAFASWITKNFINDKKKYYNSQHAYRRRNHSIQSYSPSPERKAQSQLFDLAKLDDSSKDSNEPIVICEGLDVTFGALRLLLKVDRWDDFDVFSFGEFTENAPLRTMLTYFYHSLKLDVFGIDYMKYRNFAEAVENGYNEVSYHNKYHAADVVQAVYYFLRNSNLREYISSLDVFICILSAAVHDLGHRGRTNNFEIESESKLAVRYNDISVLENHSIAVAFRLLQVPDLNILGHFKREVRKDLRETMIKIVLGTDMKSHFAHLANLKARVESHKKAGTWFDKANSKDREALMVSSVHCADISSPCRPARIAVEWTRRLENEWFSEGDEQKTLGLPVGPSMDRNNPCTEKSQVDFLKVIVKPLVESLVDAVGTKSFKPILKNLDLNIEYFEYWQKKSPNSLLQRVNSKE